MSNPSVVVADASIIINLNASGRAAEILRALPEQVVVVDVVVGELEVGRSKGRQDAELFAELICAGVLKTVQLDDVGEAHFEQLVVGPAQSTLDDGEAATIAFGLQTTVGVIIDDRKARKMCAARFPSLEVSSTCDLFRHPAVLETLGADSLRQAVYDSLTKARMSVRQENLEWVVNLLGDHAAKSCKSLPIQRLNRELAKRSG